MNIIKFAASKLNHVIYHFSGIAGVISFYLVLCAAIVNYIATFCSFIDNKIKEKEEKKNNKIIDIEDIKGD